MSSCAGAEGNPAVQSTGTAYCTSHDDSTVGPTDGTAPSTRAIKSVWVL